MSTTTEEPETVHEVRGRRVQINYDEDAHTATFHSPDIGHELDQYDDPQEGLKDIGIYTRVQNILESARNLVTVRLKPAASVELRASPDEGTTLEARPISKQFAGSTISKRRGKYGYTATVGMDLVEELFDIDEDEFEGSIGKAAVYAELHNNRLHLRVEPGDAPHAMTTRVDSTGLIGIPNGLGAAADLDGHGVNWELIEDGDALLGETTFEPKTMTFPAAVDDPNAHPADRHHIGAISHVTQEVEHDDDAWTQTHFTVYVKSGLIEHDGAPVLGWGAAPGLYEREERPTREEVLQDYIDIRLVNINGELSLYLTDDLRSKYVDEVTIEADESEDDLWDASIRSAPCIRKLYQNPNNKQVTFSFPHSLAYAMGFDDTWVSTSGTKDIATGKQVKWAVTGEDGGGAAGLLGLPITPEEAGKDPA